MKKLIIGLCFSALLVTGCSNGSSSEPKYDAVDLIHYQTCIDKYMSNTIFYALADQVTQDAMDTCKKYLPTKK